MDCYFAHLALTDFKFATSFKKKPKVFKSMLKGKMNIDDYEDGEIINQPKVGVFHGKNMKGVKRNTSSILAIGRLSFCIWK